VFSNFEKNSNLKLELEGFRVSGYNYVPQNSAPGISPAQKLMTNSFGNKSFMRPEKAQHDSSQK